MNNKTKGKKMTRNTEYATSGDPEPNTLHKATQLQSIRDYYCHSIDAAAADDRPNGWIALRKMPNVE